MTKKKLNDILLSPGATIKDAMDSLNRSPVNIIFVVNENKKVLGCVTDGDVRRGLLRNEQLSSSVGKIMRGSFISGDRHTPSAAVFDLLRKNGIRQIPILDEEGRLLDVKVLEDFIEDKKFDLPVVIMAGGRGTRLSPMTDSVPKPLLKVGDRTVIERIIMSLVSSGAHDFHITLNYLADQIRDHLGDGESLGAHINYVQEAKALGTAGSLSMLRDQIKSNFLVINGDMITNVDFKLLSQFHYEHNAAATVCAKMITINVPYGVLKTKDGNLTGIEEKPDIGLSVSSGIYLLSPEVFKYVDGGYLDMPHLLERLITAGKTVKCFQSAEPWVDIGSHEDFAKAQKYLEYLTW